MGEVSEVKGRKVLDMSWRIQEIREQCGWNLENEGKMNLGDKQGSNHVCLAGHN